MHTSRVVIACVVVTLAGCQKRDPLFCGLNPTDPRCQAGGDGGVSDVPAGYVRIGGTVSGLGTSAGLVLQDNGGDDKPILSNGPFVFATAVPIGTNYAVTVGTQPTNPSLTCNIGNGAGTATADVTDVQVTCTVAAYTIGGTVAGLVAGTEVVLTDNGVDDTTVIEANPMFVFATKIASGAGYDVQVKTQPASGGPCTVSAGTGLVGGGNVSTVVVNCKAGSYTIGGTVMGLNGIVKLHNGGDTISVTANGAFAFPTPVIMNGTYSVTVTAQPTYAPATQTCTVANGSGPVNGNVVTVAVTCTTNDYSVGGTISGVNGTVVLQNNGGDNKTFTADQNFVFPTKIPSGMTYAVTVYQEPSTLRCAVSNGSGTVTSSNVSNVAVACSYFDPGVACGATYCGSNQACCDPEGGKTCIANNGSCGSLLLGCDDASDCGGGNVCCASLNGPGNQVTGTSCTASGSCGGNHAIILCNPNASGNCPNGGACSALSILTGYDACQ